jgi:hypothetical protein
MGAADFRVYAFQLQAADSADQQGSGALGLNGAAKPANGLPKAVRRGRSVDPGLGLARAYSDQFRWAGDGACRTLG